MSSQMVPSSPVYTPNNTSSMPNERHSSSSISLSSSLPKSSSSPTSPLASRKQGGLHISEVDFARSLDERRNNFLQGNYKYHFWNYWTTQLFIANDCHFVVVDTLTPYYFYSICF